MEKNNQKEQEKKMINQKEQEKKMNQNEKEKKMMNQKVQINQKEQEKKINLEEGKMNLEIKKKKENLFDAAQGPLLMGEQKQQQKKIGNEKTLNKKLDKGKEKKSALEKGKGMKNMEKKNAVVKTVIEKGQRSNKKDGAGPVGGELVRKCSKKTGGTNPWHCPKNAAPGSNLCQDHKDMGRLSRLRTKIRKNATIEVILKYLIELAALKEGGATAGVIQSKYDDMVDLTMEKSKYEKLKGCKALEKAYEKISAGLMEAKKLEEKLMAGSQNAEEDHGGEQDEEGHSTGGGGEQGEEDHSTGDGQKGEEEH